MKKEIEAETFGTIMLCDEESCNGEMQRDESQSILCSNPPLYPHICCKCGVKVNYHHTYPSIRHRLIR